MLFDKINQKNDKIDSNNKFLARLIAGLAGNKSYIKSCSLEAINHFYKVYHEKID